LKTENYAASLQEKQKKKKDRKGQQGKRKSDNLIKNKTYVVFSILGIFFRAIKKSIKVFINRFVQTKAASEVIQENILDASEPVDNSVTNAVEENQKSVNQENINADVVQANKDEEKSETESSIQAVKKDDKWFFWLVPIVFGIIIVVVLLIVLKQITPVTEDKPISENEIYQPLKPTRESVPPIVIITEPSISD
jgi:hypothetical protein